MVNVILMHGNALKFKFSGIRVPRMLTRPLPVPGPLGVPGPYQVFPGTRLKTKKNTKESFSQTTVDWMLGPKPIQDWQNVGTPPWGYRSIVLFDFQTQWIVTNTSVLHTVTHFTSRHLFLRWAVRINELIFSSFGFPLFDISPSFTQSIRWWITGVKCMHWNILLEADYTSRIYLPRNCSWAISG